MVEEVIAGVLNFFLLLAIFLIVNRWKRKSRFKRQLTVVLHVLLVALNVQFNLCATGLFYEPLMDLFDIQTDGFMNMNGVWTGLSIWIMLASIMLYLAIHLKEQLVPYYRTIRITQIIFIILPIVVVFGFLLLAGLK